MKRISALILTGLLCAAAWAQSAGAPPRPPASKPAAPTVRAVLIAGLGGTKAYSRNLLDWTNRFHAVLTKRCGVPAKNIIVLTEAADAKAKPPRIKATVENIRQALAKTALAIRDQDQFVLFMAGHGQINEPVGKLCLPGLDLTADDLADMIDALPTDNMVIINCSSGGAEFIKTLAVPGRVLISGAGAGNDGTQAYFAEFLLRAYETGQADANKDKAIDLMEAFVYAARETGNFYHRQYLMPAGGRPVAGAANTWHVQGKQTRAIWRKLYAGTNNKLGMPATVAGEPAPPNPDTEPDAQPKFGRFDKHWHNRRVLAEHARIDDDGGRKGFFLWQPYKFQKLPPDTPGSVGFLARRTVLGKPKLLKRPVGK